MAITTRDQLINAMGNNNSNYLVDKANIASQAAGNFISMFRATGQPGQPAIPTSAVVCDTTFTGAIPFTQQTLPATSYLAYQEATTSNATANVEIHDRLMHMAGLSGTSAIAQTVALNVHANLATNNLDARKGAADYSQVNWWMEWYTATGSTPVTATINATLSDANNYNLTALSLAATRPAGQMIYLNSLVPAAQAGLYIRNIVSVTLSVSTGSAGNFGFTATRKLSNMYCPLANFTEIADWARLGLPQIHNNSFLFPIVRNATTSSGTLRTYLTIVHG